MAGTATQKYLKTETATETSGDTPSSLFDSIKAKKRGTLTEGSHYKLEETAWARSVKDVYIQKISVCLLFHSQQQLNRS